LNNLIYYKIDKYNMRLREPFNGYRLSSGHFQFHMAFLVASRIAIKILETNFADNPEAADIFF